MQATDNIFQTALVYYYGNDPGACFEPKFLVNMYVPPVVMGGLCLTFKFLLPPSWYTGHNSQIYRRNAQPPPTNDKVLQPCRH